MPILDMQLRMRELGRIRTGEQVATSKGKRPAKLDAFRLTSASKELIEAAAQAYGGTVTPWQSPAGPQWEVKTIVAALPIVIPPGEALSQWYELWSGGGCQRRCDGKTETICEEPCMCPADPADRREAANAGEACKPTTRLNVILPELPDLGVWRLESHGFYAAVELAGAARFLAIASSSGLNIPARLRLDQREKKMPGKPTNRYAVPIIEFTTTRITDLLAAGGTGLPQLESSPMSQLPATTTGQTIDPGPAPRRQKTDRPPLGAPPALPDGSGFRKRAADAPVASPPIVVPQEPETVAGWVIEDPDEAPVTEPRRAQKQAAPVPASTPDENAAAAAAAVPTDDGDEVPAGLTRDQLVEELRSIGVTTGTAAMKSKAMWPDRGETPLTDAQRLELLNALRNEYASAVAAAL